MESSANATQQLQNAITAAGLSVTLSAGGSEPKETFWCLEASIVELGTSRGDFTFSKYQRLTTYNFHERHHFLNDHEHNNCERRNAA